MTKKVKLAKITYIGQLRQPEYAQILLATCQNLGCDEKVVKGTTNEQMAYINMNIMEAEIGLSEEGLDGNAENNMVDEANSWIQIFNKGGNI